MSTQPTTVAAFTIHKSEALRDALRETMNAPQFGDVTVAELIGVLHLLAAEVIERLNRS